MDAFLRVRVASYCNKCDIITTPAASSKQRLINLGVTTPIEVVYNPTDLSAHMDATGDAVRHRFGFGPEDIVLGYVGRLAPEKNLDMLLDACQMLMPSDPRLRLLLVGDGPSREALEARAQQMGFAGRIAFAGNVHHDSVPEYDAALNMFVTPSMFEVQPLSFAEAMAAGAPVIAMDAPGANDMVEDGHNGRLVPPAEAGAGLARAIRQVLDEPGALKRLGDQAKVWAQRYDKPTVVQRLLGIYERTILTSTRE